MLLKEPTNGASDGRLSITRVKKYYHYLPVALAANLLVIHPPRDNKWPQINLFKQVTGDDEAISTSQEAKLLVSTTAAQFNLPQIKSLTFVISF